MNVPNYSSATKDQGSNPAIFLKISRLLVCLSVIYFFLVMEQTFMYVLLCCLLLTSIAVHASANNSHLRICLAACPRASIYPKKWGGRTPNYEGPEACYPKFFFKFWYTETAFPAFWRHL